MSLLTDSLNWTDCSETDTVFWSSGLPSWTNLSVSTFWLIVIQ